MKTALLFMYTESPLHAGTGSSVSVVDLPIQRERATQYPIVQGSGVKGALRSQWRGSEDEKIVVFGPDVKSGKASDHAGAVSVGEARIVLFPVRSLAGVFAYVTCPLVLSRLARDLGNAGSAAPWSSLPQITAQNALVTQTTDLDAGNKHAVLEEFDFSIQANAEMSAIAAWLASNAFPAGPEYDYWRKKVQTSLIVLHDDDFREFVVNSTEISTHVKLNPTTKTAADTGLWTQEALPADALLYSVLVARAPRTGRSTIDEVYEWLTDIERIEPRIQLGGDETTGSGVVALRWA